MKLLTFVVCFLATLVSCAPMPSASPPPPAQSEAEIDDDATEYAGFGEPIGTARATRHCAVRGALADPLCTPGAIMTTDLDIICHQSTKQRRNVPTSLKRQVFADYGIAYPEPAGAYEIDHEIPLELGGSNEIPNLWPEAAEPRPGFREKDVLESQMHRRVCAGEMSIQDAQRAIATDWLAARR